MSRRSSTPIYELPFILYDSLEEAEKSRKEKRLYSSFIRIICANGRIFDVSDYVLRDCKIISRMKRDLVVMNSSKLNQEIITFNMPFSDTEMLAFFTVSEYWYISDNINNCGVNIDSTAKVIEICDYLEFDAIMPALGEFMASFTLSKPLESVRRILRIECDFNENELKQIKEEDIYRNKIKPRRF